MKTVTHSAAILHATHLNLAFDLIEGQAMHTKIAMLALGFGPLLVVCKGAVFVMPWYEVKSEFERIANWYKLESPAVKKPYFRLKVLTKPIGNEEILTALYAGVEGLSRTESVKP